MKRLAYLVVLFPLLALGGESALLGTLVSTGTAVTNATTATPFVIPPGVKISIQCDATAYVLTDSTTVAASGTTRGVKLAADQLLATSVGVSKNIVVISSDKSAQVAMISSSGTANCFVYSRAGNE